MSKASPIALTASKGLENERRRKNTRRNHLKSATFSLNDHDNVVQTLLSSSASPIILTLEPTHQKPTTLTFYPLPHFLLCGLHVDVKKKQPRYQVLRLYYPPRQHRQPQPHFSSGTPSAPHPSSSVKTFYKRVEDRRVHWS